MHSILYLRDYRFFANSSRKRNVVEISGRQLLQRNIHRIIVMHRRMIAISDSGNGHITSSSVKIMGHEQCWKQKNIQKDLYCDLCILSLSNRRIVFLISIHSIVERNYGKRDTTMLECS
ncbi:hypothetical protein QQG55_56045 [Brugia pahangi]